MMMNSKDSKSNFLNFYNIQKFFFEYIYLFKLKLIENDYGLEVNMPIFHPKAKNNFNDTFGREIDFDTINDYEIYSLSNNSNYYFDNFDYVKNKFDKLKQIHTNTDNYLMFSNDNEIKRDFLFKSNMVEIQSNNINGIFFAKEEQYPPINFIKLLYLFIYNTFNNLKKKYNLNFEIPKTIKIFTKSLELKKSRFFDIDLVLENILIKEGIIIWLNDEDESYEMYGLSTISNASWKLMKVWKSSLAVGTIFNNFNSALRFKLNMTNIILFLLQSDNTSDLF